MLTLFSCPKPFTNPCIRQIQRNAIGSWIQLQPRPEILLLGNEEGVAEVAADFGVRHIPDLALNEFGTPLVNSIFKQAEVATTNSLLCYVNSDIMLLNDFMDAAQGVACRKRRFLVVGQRWDIDITETIDYSNPHWQDNLRCLLAARGVLHPKTGMDYFLFPRGFWSKIPPFALGRSAWDNWLLFRARQRGAAVIDATQAITAVHQNHDYTHIPGGKKAAWVGAEAEQNWKLAEKGIFTLLDANCLLTPRGLVRIRTANHRRRERASWTLRHPGWSMPYRLMKKLISIAKRILRFVLRRSQ